MILGTLQYPSRYGGLGVHVLNTLKFLAGQDLSLLEPGHHVLDTGAVFVDVLEVLTVIHDSKLFEAHEKYIDIHLTLSGEEWYGYVPINNVMLAQKYDPETDVAWYRGEGVYFQVPKGQFVLFFPEDAHKPCVTFDRPGHVKKIVAKIEI